MRVVFMGTPDFAVPCLEALLQIGEEVVAVYTQPDKPKGRKQILTPSPVKEFAVMHNLKVLQPASFRNNEEAVQTLQNLHPDLVVVVAFGQLLPPEILQIPPYGCINVHASLLPRYRGAAPIQYSILNGCLLYTSRCV